MSDFINPFGTNATCYKANLHTHSTTSDGKLSVEELCRAYRKRKYDIIAVTDHYRSNAVSALIGSEITVINGMEFHPQGPRNILFHIVALNIPENFKHPSSLTCQDGIKRVIAAGGECFLAHPYWSGFTVADILPLNRLIIGIEVFNSASRYIGKSFSMQIWDDLLDAGMMVPAFAVDDTHNPRDMFRGWTMICAKDKSATAVMEAIKHGHFYSTMGPEFHKISLKGRTLTINCTPAVEIIGICNRNNGECGNIPEMDATLTGSSCVHYKTVEKTECVINIPHDPAITYVRCQIMDKFGNYAWTNPIRLAK
jgi:hypothetical protein